MVTHLLALTETHRIRQHSKVIEIIVGFFYNVIVDIRVQGYNDDGGEVVVAGTDYDIDRNKTLLYT